MWSLHHRAFNVYIVVLVFLPPPPLGLIFVPLFPSSIPSQAISGRGRLGMLRRKIKLIYYSFRAYVIVYTASAILFSVSPSPP